MTVDRFLIVYAFLVLTVAITLKQSEIMASSTLGSEFNKRAAAFALDIYQHVVKNKENENVIMSPLSIHTALGLAYMGAAGKTQEEMASGLRISDDKKDAADRFSHVLCKYKNSTMLKIANKVYVQQGYELNPDFKETSQKNFKSEAENLDFKNANSAADTINFWVESKTNNKIKNLIDPSNLSEDSRMVLINAIYFKGFWKHQFKPENTRRDQFFTSETESIEVDMMSATQHFAYGDLSDLDAKAIEMPYENTDLSMLIILPNKRTGLKDLESKLGSIDLPALRKKMHNTEVVVKIPKFKIEFSIELNNVLKEMGMPTMFSSSADFSALLKTSEPLFISKVIHKAFIEVNEEGAEAAAATAHFIRKRCIHIPMEFSADHPFLYAIIDTDENTSVVFNGALKKMKSLHVTNQSHDEL